MSTAFDEPRDLRGSSCDGPLVWFDVEPWPRPCGHAHAAAVLECAACDYVVTSGNFNDRIHANTDVIRSPR